MKAFITGGNRGIGRGIARILADAGYDIAFTYGSAEEEAYETKREIIEKGRRCFCYQASLEKPEVPGDITRRAIEDLGGLDAIICNAALSRIRGLMDTDMEMINHLFNLNYRAYLFCAKEAASYMIANGVKGNIVFITSTRGERAYPNDVVYAGLKAGINHSAESLAVELSKHRIRVNCVAPGATAIRGSFTQEDLSKRAFAKQIPLGRMGTPDEVGHLVKYVISPEAGYMTGNIIKLDGGLILPGMTENDAFYEKAYGK